MAYMIATKAIHKLGDISRDYGEQLEERGENLCYANKEDEENYIGSWVTGFGFIEVKFPKQTTRKLTQEEITYFNTKSVQISNQLPIKLNIK